MKTFNILSTIVILALNACGNETPSWQEQPCDSVGDAGNQTQDAGVSSDGNSNNETLSIVAPAMNTEVGPQTTSIQVCFSNQNILNNSEIASISLNTAINGTTSCGNFGYGFIQPGQPATCITFYPTQSIAPECLYDTSHGRLIALTATKTYADGTSVQTPPVDVLWIGN